MHCDIFRHGFVESVWRVLLSATAGVPVESYRPTHNMNHHVYLGGNIAQILPLRWWHVIPRYTQHGDHLDTKQMKYKWHLLNLLLFFPTATQKWLSFQCASLRISFHKRLALKSAKTKSIVWLAKLRSRFEMQFLNFL